MILDVTMNIILGNLIDGSEAVIPPRQSLAGHWPDPRGSPARLAALSFRGLGVRV